MLKKKPWKPKGQKSSVDLLTYINMKNPAGPKLDKNIVPICTWTVYLPKKVLGKITTCVKVKFMGRFRVST